MSFVLSSHLLRDVEECCQEVLILKDGRIAVYCDLEEERRANRRFLELETSGDEDGGFAQAVGSLGCECARQGRSRMKVILPEGLDVRLLYQIAGERRVQIRRLNYRRDSLQDIFMKAMEAQG